MTLELEKIRSVGPIVQSVQKSKSFQKIPARVFIKNALLLDKNHETHLAINFLRASLIKYPDHLELFQTLAELLEKDKKYEEARRLRFHIMNQNYQFESVYHYANNFYLQGLDAEALSYYFEALSLLKSENSFIFDLYKNIGNIQLRQGDFEGAEEYYNKAYAINSKADVLLVNIGTLEIQKNNFEKSNFCFKEAIILNEKNDKAWVGLAMIQSHKNDLELAWGNVRHALEINPRNRTAISLMSQWAFILHKVDELIFHLQTYLSLEDFDLEFSKLLIHCFCELGQFPLAHIEIQRGLLFFPADAALKNLKHNIKELV